MIREEISGYAEPPRPAHKARAWTPIVLVVFVGLGIAHVAGLTKPLTAMALDLVGPHAPGGHLVGDWESDNDPMFRRISYVAANDGKAQSGIYLGHAGRGTRGVVYRIVAQDRFGRNLELAEYWPDVDYNYRARYSIAGNGKSLTREYTDRDGTRVSSHYRYLGPPTEDPPRRFQP